MTALQPDIKLTIDARGLRCPLPVLKVQKAMRTLGPGDVLMIQTTDPVSPLDLTHFCEEHGHTMISRDDHHDGSYCFVIAKGS
ncbi:MAG: sulfurtransferase TusA family protein [Alphaproteobacteria bacterium]